MKLYIMRHGQAQLAAESDKARNLTPTGRDQSTFVAKWLAMNDTDFDITFVSPYNRALETYQLVSEHTGSLKSKSLQHKSAQHHFVLEELTPESDPASCGDSLLAYCAQHKAESALVVSHLPLVGLLISDLCPSVVIANFATSSVACLEIDLENWQGKLLWHKSYEQLSMPQSG